MVIEGSVLTYLGDNGFKYVRLMLFLTISLCTNYCKKYAWAGCKTHTPPHALTVNHNDSLTLHTVFLDDWSTGYLFSV